MNFSLVIQCSTARQGNSGNTTRTDKHNSLHSEVQNPQRKLDKQAKIKEPCPYLRNCTHNNMCPIQGLILRV